MDSWLDSIIGFFSPQKAMLRTHYRRMNEDKDYHAAVMLSGRGYASALSGNNSPWINTGAKSADAENAGSLSVMRDRSRELYRDDSVGSGILKTFVRKVVGTGLVPQARTGNKNKNTSIEEVFASLSRNLSPVDNKPYAALQRMRFKKLLEDGEVFVKATRYPGIEGIKTETIEADRVVSPIALSLTVQDGIQKDANGIVVAYWVDGQSIPADQIYHIRLSDRPGQTRGVPILHAVLQDIKDLDVLLHASLKRAQIAACLALFIESSADTANMLPTSQEKYGYQLDQDIEPGMIFKTFPGETISTLVPNFPSPELPPFVKVLAQRIGAALGVSWQTILNDWSDANYSSARTQILEDRPTYAILGDDFTDFLSWERRLVFEDARMRGVATISDKQIEQVAWIGDAQPWVDPKKQTDSIEAMLRLNLTTLQIENAKLGQDWEEVLKQRALEKDMSDELMPAPVMAPADEPEDDNAV